MPLRGRFVQDLRHGFRLLARNRAFTAVAVLTLAIGIGANTALFSVVDCLLIRPLPYPHAERLFSVWSRPPKGGITNLSGPNFLDFRGQNRVFDSMGAAMLAEFNIVVNGAADRLHGARISAGFLETLGVPPALGRAFADADNRPGAPRVAMLSHRAWQRRFGGDPRVVGSVLTVDGAPTTVVGVTPANFRFPYQPELWAPLELDPSSPRDFHVLFACGRLKAGLNAAQAKANLDTIAGNLARAWPNQLKDWGIELHSWRDNMVGPQQSMLILFGAVGLVLLIACVNVANLLLAKAAARRRELAVRASLGAGPGRLALQVLSECLLLALMGGAAGVLLAVWLVKAVATLVPAVALETVAEIGIDGRVLIFSFLLSVAAGLLFGMFPAWRSSRVNLNEELKGGGNLSGSAHHRLRAALVVVEVAVSIVLMAGAGLLARSLAAMYSDDPGIVVDNVLTMRLTMPEARYGGPAQVRAFNRDLLARVQALPGVRAAAVSSFLPFQGMATPMRFQIASRPVPPADVPRAGFWYVSDGWLEALRVPLRKGRFFSAADDELAPRVVVVNQAFARRFFEKEEVLGKTLLLDERWMAGAVKNAPPRPWEIVGVVGDIGLTGLSDQARRPFIYAPALQWPRAGGALTVSARRAPESLLTAIRAVVRELDREVPLTEVRTMRQLADSSVAYQRGQAWLYASFAAVALILAALGIYGMVSCAVEQRTPEIGIRMALGASPGQVLAVTLRSALTIVGAGLCLGLLGALALTRVIASLLYRVRPHDPLTYVAVALLLSATGALAAWIPARRAARVDPLIALRWE